MKLRFLHLPVLAVILSAALVLAGCTQNKAVLDATPAPTSETDSLPEEVTTSSEGVLEKSLPAGVDPVIAGMTFDNSWMLKDSVGGDAVGVVTTTFSDKFYLQADMQNLPPLGENQFYEGWVVRSFPHSVISTGALIQTPDGWVNQFTSTDDLTDHTQYFVTLEPTNDGQAGEADPAPTSIHVLEGRST